MSENVFLLEEIIIEPTSYISSHIYTFWQDFKDWLYKSPSIDLGFGIIIGTMFTKIINSFMNDILLPPIGKLFDKKLTNMFYVIKYGHSNVEYVTLKDAIDDGAITENYGLFIENCLTFLAICFIIYILVRLFNMFKRKTDINNDINTKCKACCCEINKYASRCPFCTSYT